MRFMQFRAKDHYALELSKLEKVRVRIYDEITMELESIIKSNLLYFNLNLRCICYSYFTFNLIDFVPICCFRKRKIVVHIYITCSDCHLLQGMSSVPVCLIHYYIRSVYHHDTGFGDTEEHI